MACVTQILIACVGGALVEIGKCVSVFIYPRISSCFVSQSNLDNLNLEITNLSNQKGRVEAQKKAAERDGYLLNPAVDQWLFQVEKEEKEVASITTKIEARRKFCCCLRRRMGSDMESEVTNKLNEVRNCVKAGNFCSVHDGVRIIEHELGARLIEVQSTASQNLSHLLQLLEREDVGMIGVWGMGGVGKTTLVTNLINHLENTASFSFGVVIYVKVSKQWDVTKIQTQIAKKLKLVASAKESKEDRAKRITSRLRQEEKYLLVLDDVWEEINLDSVGIPLREHHFRGKVLLTTRLLRVCGEMMTDENFKVEVLNEQESWRLFTRSANLTTTPGVDPHRIEQYAKDVARECAGLPLAIVVVGKSMRGATTVHQWRDALNALRKCLVTHIDGMEDKVYNVIKWSYDSIKCTHMKSLFLYCSLYPEDDDENLVDELLRSWLAEVRLIDELQSYVEAFDRSVTLVQHLKDSCLLECVDAQATNWKMHDVVRDVARWIASSSEDGCKSLVESGIGLRDISQVQFPDSVKRVSFMLNDITKLPEGVMQCSEASMLLLQGNRSLLNVPEGFLLSFKALSVLDLSETGIRSLPPSLSQLSELKALLLFNCRGLQELPPLGGLNRLQLLDCSRTGLKEWPQGIEKLTDLRLLNLLDTECLNRIPDGILSELCSLEELQMTQNTYPWGPATIGELSCLKKLKVCNIVLDTSCLASDRLSCLVTKLERFRFAIIAQAIPIVYPSSDVQMEKVVTIICLSLSGRQFGWLLNKECTLVLYDCDKLEELPASLGRNRSFSKLRSLQIKSYKGRFPSGCAEFSPIPNLEELVLESVSYLEGISNLEYFIGFDFSRLKALKVSNCRSLRHLFSVGDSIPTLHKLEVVEVNQCSELDKLFRCGSSSQTTIFPVLKELKLHDLPNLHTLCGEHESWRHLELLEVKSCDLIRRLPLNTESARTIKRIKGSQQWWSQLEWDREGSMSSLQPYFQSI